MKFKRFAGVILIIVFTLATNSMSAFADDKSDVVATVNRFLDNLDDKTLDKALAMCDSPVSIIDEFPPHEWHGPTACADWWKALNAYNAQNDITDGSATLGSPWNVEVSGDRAYYVAPMTYIYKQHGKSVKEIAAFAVALKRTQAGWRIRAWAYSKE
jgi:hypothetical protein